MPYNYVVGYEHSEFYFIIILQMNIKQVLDKLNVVNYQQVLLAVETYYLSNGFFYTDEDLYRITDEYMELLEERRLDKIEADNMTRAILEDKDIKGAEEELYKEDLIEEYYNEKYFWEFYIE